jgi:hypothetical protein
LVIAVVVVIVVVVVVVIAVIIVVGTAMSKVIGRGSPTDLTAYVIPERVIASGILVVRSRSLPFSPLFVYHSPCGVNVPDGPPGFERPVARRQAQKQKEQQQQQQWNEEEQNPQRFVIALPQAPFVVLVPKLAVVAGDVQPPSAFANPVLRATIVVVILIVPSFAFSVVPSETTNDYGAFFAFLFSLVRRRFSRQGKPSFFSFRNQLPIHDDL